MIPARWSAASHSAAKSAVIEASLAIGTHRRIHAAILFGGVVYGHPVGCEASVVPNCMGGAITEVPS